MPNPNAASPADPQIPTLFQEQLARSGAMRGLAPAGPALWPRFAGYYPTVTLTNSTVESNSVGQSGGGIFNSGTVTLTNSTVESNSAQSRGGGIYTTPGSDYQGIHIITLINSSISRNTAGTSGGGVTNGDLLTLTNSTVSGNTAVDRGGAVENTGTVTFTNSTVSRNASGRVAGGLFNTGTVTLVQSLLSGNTAPVNGPEAYSVAGQGTVTADGFNVIGHDGSAGIAGFTLAEPPRAGSPSPAT